MTPAPAKEIRLTPAAEKDLDEIWDFTVRTWSVQQAETYLRGMQQAFLRIAEQPERAREMRDISPPVRLYRYQSHIIIYRAEDKMLNIVRIAHMRQNWQALFE
ncbi:type II toxin-antitoxin system RelE/ParE family toxin [Actibacterium ureilyticum]|uniref:type II toxin-antitoxin system RelE/ParE family toxin n=1 Tax=Actibacterium ureilyticum TaxID=1590614 RepID=UPI00159576CF|nr:type II toxin-antitoxin system RelE/ParE family toxin [Actibacterium ureilyticum]